MTITVTTSTTGAHYKAVDFAHELWMIRIQPGGEFKFTPGQYATLGVQGEVKRSEGRIDRIFSV